MSYIDSHLLANEQVLYRAKLHWIIFAIPVICMILALVFFLSHSVLTMLGVLFLTLAVVTGIGDVITYFSSEYGLTNKRVVIKIGFIRRHSMEILLQRIESIQVSQTLLGRLLGYGTIVVCGTGGSRDPFYRIAEPLAFRRRVQEQLEKLLTPH